MAARREGGTGLRYGLMALPRDPEETREMARRAEAAGFEWLGVADSPVVYQESYLHQREALAVTERLRVGPLVSHVVARHPVIVANLLATLSELSGGRAVGTLATGNSAARGLGLRPAGLAALGEAVDAIRGVFDGVGGAVGDGRIPASGIRRRGCPLLIAADGPRAAALAGSHGDGILYGGTMEPSVMAARVAAARTRAGQQLWMGPAMSLGERVEDVLEDMGAMVVAQANRAFRGDLDAHGVPRELHGDVAELWRRYDYAFHADNARPRNMDLVSPELARYLVERFVVWGDAARWRSQLRLIRAHGFDGVMFILGQGEQLAVVDRLAGRLAELGELRTASAAPTIDNERSTL